MITETQKEPGGQATSKPKTTEVEKQERLVVTNEEFQEMLGISHNLFHRLKNQGKLPRQLDLGGRTVRYLRKDVIKYVENYGRKR